jgi:ubiquinone/menaquinone biosynthesis methyltransferase
MKTKPAGEESAASTLRGPDSRAVRQMFAEIAHRYDFLNHLLSASVDRRWRRIATAKVREHVRSGLSTLCLDMCSGTGDLALELHRRLNVGVVASDFCHPMLVRSLSKTRARRLDGPIRTVEADSLAIPFPVGVFDAVTIAFGLRNLEDPGKGLVEMRRVLKPDGVLLIRNFPACSSGAAPRIQFFTAFCPASGTFRTDTACSSARFCRPLPPGWSRATMEGRASKRRLSESSGRIAAMLGPEAGDRRRVNGSRKALSPLRPEGGRGPFLSYYENPP